VGLTSLAAALIDFLDFVISEANNFREKAQILHVGIGN
jgi:hypothetical protein